MSVEFTAEDQSQRNKFAVFIKRVILKATLSIDLGRPITTEHNLEYINNM